MMRNYLCAVHFNKLQKEPYTIFIPSLAMMCNAYTIKGLMNKVKISLYNFFIRNSANSIENYFTHLKGYVLDKKFSTVESVVNSLKDGEDCIAIVIPLDLEVIFIDGMHLKFMEREKLYNFNGTFVEFMSTQHHHDYKHKLNLIRDFTNFVASHESNFNPMETFIGNYYKSKKMEDKESISIPDNSALNKKLEELNEKIYSIRSYFTEKLDDVHCKIDFVWTEMKEFCPTVKKMYDTNKESVERSNITMNTIGCKQLSNESKMNDLNEYFDRICRRMNELEEKLGK